MKHWKLAALSALVGIGIAFPACLLFFEWRYALPPRGLVGWRPSTLSNAWVGLREEDIRKRYGDPTSDRPGYEGVGLRQPQSMPTGPLRTLKYRIEDGWLTFWLEHRGDHWGCFESLWVRNGFVF